MQLFSRPASAARQPAESRSPGAARRIRKTGVVAAAAAVVMALSACGGGSSPQNADGPVELRFSWWGGDKRAQLTQEAIAAFEAENPNIKIKPEFGDWSGYWDKLATQVAANDAPDIIQMDEKYITEYSSRGALLDLSQYEIDTSKLDEAALNAGRNEDGLTGIAAGINAATILANPAVFEAAGVALPDAFSRAGAWLDHQNAMPFVPVASPLWSSDAASASTTSDADGTAFFSLSCFRKAHHSAMSFGSKPSFPSDVYSDLPFWRSQTPSDASSVPYAAAP